MLMGLVVFNQSGTQAILLYLSIYIFMNMGLLCCLIEATTGSVSIEQYEGLGWRMPLIGTAMTIFLLAFMGIPPLGGFIAKLYVFSAIIDQGWYLLAVIGVFNGVISLYYYARIIRAMYSKFPGEFCVCYWL